MSEEQPRINLQRHAETFIPQRILDFTTTFLETEAVSGLLLLGAALLALAWANSPWGSSYNEFWSSKILLDLPHLRLEEDLRHVVNDGLMAIFFFVVGLEIKRELIYGELADRRAVFLPAFGAVGGMLMPAAIYVVLNLGGDMRGWGIPVATDIAFAVGLLALLGSRLPFSGRIFLLTLAVVDDIGAILLIALFYTRSLSYGYIAAALLVFVAIVAMNHRGVRSVPVYLMTGLLLWLALFESGVHPTIAGVVLGLLTPSISFYDRMTFVPSTRDLVDRFEMAIDSGSLTDQDELLEQVEDITIGSQTPLQSLERSLHPWSSHVIMPLFALANAGIVLSSDRFADALTNSVFLGVALGLFLGKPIGIGIASFLTLHAGAAGLPAGLHARHVAGLGMMSGIGFTVSLFITDIAFTQESSLEAAKLAILCASLASGLASFLFLRLSSGRGRS